jgi:hypothetical protein
MGRGWQAFGSGWRQVGRYWQLLLLLFGLNLLGALLLVLFPAGALASSLGYRPALNEAVDGLDPWLVMESLLSSQIEAGLDQAGVESDPPSGLRPALQAGLLSLALVPLLAWIMGAFLTGGVLLTYAESPRPFRWGRFGYGCWHWFGVFLLLGLLQGLVVVVGLVIGLFITGFLIALMGPWVLWPLVAALLVGMVVGLVLFDYTRILAVTGGRRNLFRTFIQALRFLFRRPLALAGLYLPILLLLGLLYLLYNWGLNPYLPPNLWLLVVLVQQSVIVVRLWTRLTRLAGGVTLVA